MLKHDPDSILILLVEDNEQHIDLIKNSFDNAPKEYSIETVRTIDEAAAFLAGKTPRLVLSEYLLPDGEGIELIQLIDNSSPVILMTSEGNEEKAVAALKAGARDYVVKSGETFVSMPLLVDLALREWELAEKSRKSYEAITRAKREWEQTFDAVTDMICIIGAEYEIMRVNRAMSDRFGVKPEELIGRRCYEVLHGQPSPLPDCPHARMIRGDAGHIEEIEQKMLGGFFDVTVSPLRDPEGKISACVHVARDVTERKKAEEERLQMEQKFQQTQRLESLGVLTGGIAHDFNNILTIILGYCHIIINGIDPVVDPILHVKQVEKAASRAADLCRQMLTYAGKNSLVKTLINMNQLVDENVKMLKSAIKRNINIELELKPDVPEIVGDNAQIQQVVMNLIINAAEAIGERGGIIRIRLEKKTVRNKAIEKDFFGNRIRNGEYACLEVSDNGCGMSIDTQKRIFEPFYTTKFTGRGLGMSVLLGIINSHEGGLQLFSEPGKGSRFRLYFPLQKLPYILDDRQTNILPPETRRGSGTILLVDDEESIRIIGLTLFKALGFSVVTAENGREALEIYRERKDEIDLILLDLLMPDMGGIETYLELREISQTVPIVVCSGYSLEEITPYTENDRYAAVAQKPYRPGELREKIMRLLEKPAKETPEDQTGTSNGVSE